MKRYALQEYIAKANMNVPGFFFATWQAFWGKVFDAYMRRRVLQALLHSSPSKLMESMMAVPVHLRKTLRALLQNMLTMHLHGQPLTFAMLSMPPLRNEDCYRA